MAHLVAALRRFGDPMMPLQVHNYERVPFRLSAAVKVAADFLATGVLPSVRALLLERFGFDGREFGQPIAQDEVVAVIHTVPGVEAVRLSALCLTGSSSLQKILWPTLPFASPTVAPLPAQLLVIDADRLDVEEMA